jgi:hypothetical protein
VGPHWGHNWRGNLGNQREGKRPNQLVRGHILSIDAGGEGPSIGLENLSMTHRCLAVSCWITLAFELALSLASTSGANRRPLFSVEARDSS